MAWCFEDESSPYADVILDRLDTEEAIVPNLFPLELANVLLVGERRKRLTEADTVRFLRLLGDLRITIDTETSLRALKETLSVARENNLSEYDAVYLELAMREGLPLATFDEPLKKAASKVGVSIAKM